MFYVYFRILLIAKNQVKGIRQLQLSLEQNGHLGSQLNHLNEVGADFVSMTDLSSSRRDTRDGTNIQQDTTTHACILLSPGTESPNVTSNNDRTNSSGNTTTGTGLFVKGSLVHKKKKEKDSHHSFANAMESLGLKRLSATSTSTTSNQGNVVVPSLVVDPAARSVERSLRRRSRQLVTDTKAIRTLGIVMGVFCACW